MINDIYGWTFLSFAMVNIFCHQYFDRLLTQTYCALHTLLSSTDDSYDAFGSLILLKISA